MATGADAKGRMLLTKPLPGSASGNPEKFQAIQAVMLVDQQGNPVNLAAGTTPSEPAPSQTATTVIIPESTGQVLISATPESAGRASIYTYSAYTGDGLSYKTGQVWVVRAADGPHATAMEFGDYGPEMLLDFAARINPETGDMELLADNLQPDSQACSFSFFKQTLP